MTNVKEIKILLKFIKMEIEKLRELVICPKCMHFLQDPIRLPCNSICKMHLNELVDKSNPNRIDCEFCKEHHDIPKNGFKKDHLFDDIVLNQKHLRDEEKRINQKIETKLQTLNDSFKNLKENYDLIKPCYEKINLIKLKIDKYFSDKIQRIDRIKISDNENEINQLITCWEFEKNSLELEDKSNCELRTETLLSKINDDLKNIRTFPELLKGINKFVINENGKSKLN